MFLLTNKKIRKFITSFLLVLFICTSLSIMQLSFVIQLYASTNNTNQLSSSEMKKLEEEIKENSDNSSTKPVESNTKSDTNNSYNTKVDDTITPTEKSVNTNGTVDPLDYYSNILKSNDDIGNKTVDNNVTYRDEYTKLIKSGSNQTTMEVYDTPIAELNTKGEYKKIDNKVTKSSLFSNTYINESGNVNYVLNDDSSTNVQYDDKTVLTISTTNKSIKTTDDSGIIYSTNDDSQLSYINEGQLNIVSYNNDTSNYNYNYSLKLEEGYKLVEENNSIFVTNDKEERLLKVVETNPTNVDIENKETKLSEINKKEYKLEVKGSVKSSLNYPSFSVVTVNKQFASGFEVHGIHTQLKERILQKEMVKYQ